jgi:hypothetical protein
MNDDFETPGPELTDDEEALLKEMPALTGVGQSRCTFLVGRARACARNASERALFVSATA